MCFEKKDRWVFNFIIIPIKAELKLFFTTYTQQTLSTSLVFHCCIYISKTCNEKKNEVELFLDDFR